MSQHIKPRLCKFCTDSRTHRPGKVSIKSYPERGRVWQYGICESCGMRYTPAEVKDRMAHRIWDNPKLLARLEVERERKVEPDKRFTFNCYHLGWRGDRAYCRKGFMFLNCKDGTMPLISALRGLNSSVCLKCKFYDEG